MTGPDETRENLRGALIMTAATACYAVNDMLLKTISDDLTLAQIVFFRGVLATGMIALLVWRQGAFRTRRFPPGQGRLVALRLAGELGATLMFLIALFNMPLADVTAILQFLPVVLVGVAWAFFGESLGWRRLTAIAVGFVGVLLIVKPGMAGFSVYALVALGAVAALALRDLVSARLAPEIPSSLVTLMSSAAVALPFGLIALTQPAPELTPRIVLTLIACAAAIAGAYHLSIVVMRVGNMVFVAPFRYTALIWAMLLGWLAFGEWPDGLTLIGAGLVALAGIITLLRSPQRRRLATRAATGRIAAEAGVGAEDTAPRGR